MIWKISLPNGFNCVISDWSWTRFGAGRLLEASFYHVYCLAAGYCGYNGRMKAQLSLTYGKLPFNLVFQGPWERSRRRKIPLQSPHWRPQSYMTYDSTLSSVYAVHLLYSHFHEML